MTKYFWIKEITKIRLNFLKLINYYLVNVSTVNAFNTNAVAFHNSEVLYIIKLLTHNLNV